MHSIREEHALPLSIGYVRPKTRAEAIELLAHPGHQAAPFIIHPKPTALRRMGMKTLVDLSLLGLNTILETQDETVHIGALATLQQMVEEPLLNAMTRGILGQAARLVAGPGIRNLSGLWGAIQARSGPPEVILALLVLESKVVLLGAGEKQRSLAFPEFYEQGVDSFQPGELVMEVCLPPAGTGCGCALERIARTPRDEAIVAAAAVVEVKDGRARRVCLALAGANPLPIRLPLVEDMLTGKTFETQTIQTAVKAIMAQAHPLGDFRGSSDYRRAMAGLVVRRVLEKAWEQANSLGTEV